MKVGKNQRKILLLLEAGCALSLSASPRQVFRIIRGAAAFWKVLNRLALQDSLRRLYESRLIDTKDHHDNSVTIVLTNSGKRKALTYKLDEMHIERPRVWDGKWRIIAFDIPERKRKARDALREHLERMGCHELQRSVFVHPFPCWDEVDFLTEFFHVRPHVRQILATEIDTAPHLRHIFRI